MAFSANSVIVAFWLVDVGEWEGHPAITNFELHSCLSKLVNVWWTYETAVRSHTLGASSSVFILIGSSKICGLAVNLGQPLEMKSVILGDWYPPRWWSEGSEIRSSGELSAYLKANSLWLSLCRASFGQHPDSLALQIFLWTSTAQWLCLWFA